MVHHERREVEQLRAAVAQQARRRRRRRRGGGQQRVKQPEEGNRVGVGVGVCVGGANREFGKAWGEGGRGCRTRVVTRHWERACVPDALLGSEVCNMAHGRSVGPAQVWRVGRPTLHLGVAAAVRRRRPPVTYILPTQLNSIA
eukprot:364883-Chlamydomonas_euryale.AAC.2